MSKKITYYGVSLKRSEKILIFFFMLFWISFSIVFIFAFNLINDFTIINFSIVIMPTLAGAFLIRLMLVKTNLKRISITNKTIIKSPHSLIQIMPINTYNIGGSAMSLKHIKIDINNISKLYIVDNEEELKLAKKNGQLMTITMKLILGKTLCFEFISPIKMSFFHKILKKPALEKFYIQIDDPEGFIKHIESLKILAT